MAAENHTRINPGKMLYTIKVNSFRARIASWVLRKPSVAMVWSSKVLLHGVSEEAFKENKKWLKHELKHVEQFQRYGFYIFIMLYLWESICKGYHNNRYEQEARQAEKDEGIEQRYILHAAH
jgi:hypothetical protein